VAALKHGRKSPAPFAPKPVLELLFAFDLALPVPPHGIASDQIDELRPKAQEARHALNRDVRPLRVG